MAFDAQPQPIPDRAQLGAALRDLELAKARVERDARQVADDAKKQLVSQLLPVLDNLDRTIKSATENGDAPAVVEGIGLVKTQLEGVLRGYGVERIDAAGVPFDPAVHEAVTTLPVPTAATHNHVVDQLAPGYRFGAQLLRPAQVVVGTFAAPEPAVVEPEPVVEAEPAVAAEAPQRQVDFDEEPPARPQPSRPRYVDQYGRPCDQYGRPLRLQQFDQYGRPIQYDAYGRPIPHPQPWNPFTRRYR